MVNQDTRLKTEFEAGICFVKLDGYEKYRR